MRAYVNRGDVYDKKGDKDRAISSYRRALDFDPVHKGALDALAKLGATP